MGFARGVGIALAFAALAGCTPQATLEDARAAAATAQAAVQQALALQQQGQTEAAMDEAARAEIVFADARDLYFSARADLSDDPDVLIEFAELCDRLNDDDLAGEAFLRAAASRPEDATLWYRAGRCFVDAGGRYLARAAEPLDRAETLSRSASGAVAIADIEAARGDVSWKNGAYDIAGTRYAAALAADPTSARALMGAAKVAVATGVPAQAEARLGELQTAARVDPNVVEARLREAYLVYRRMRPALPADAAEYRALAGIAVRSGFIDEARAAVEHSLTLDPNDVVALNMAGSLAQRAGDYARARQAFSRSLELQPDQPRTREALTTLPAPGSGQGPLL